MNWKDAFFVVYDWGMQWYPHNIFENKLYKKFVQ